ncbi:MAG: hypothetical protein RBT59_01535 [Arcobacteraceae bacterium]|jgi:hypothetical protein|nr:hypothetical protein [Arcobacteraceae bacterium]
MKKSLQLQLGMGLLVGTIFFSGCASATTPFTEFKKPQNNESVLYIYRPSKFVAGGEDYKLIDKASNELLGELENGTYFEKTVKPRKMVVYGKYNFFKDNQIEIEIEPNKVTCLKSYIGGFIQNIQFEKVDLETCKKEIVETKKIVQ